MIAAHCLCSQIGVVAAAGTHAHQLAVSLKEEGVIIYDARTQKPVKTWALGLPGQRLAGSLAYDARSGRYFAAAQPATDGASVSATLLSWPRKSDAGSLKQAAQQAQLPAPVHSLHPLPAAAAAAAQREQAAGGGSAMDVDGGSGSGTAGAQAMVFAVYANGTVAACDPAGVLSENVEARGLEPLAAAATEAGLAVVHLDPRGGGATCSSYCLQDGKVQCGPITQLSPPEAGGRAVAAAAAADRVAVLWSDGTLAVYPSCCGGGGSSGPLQPLLCRRLRGLVLRQQGAAPQNGKLHRGSRKRGHGAGGAAAGAVSLAALGGGLLAVAGWSTEAPGTAAVRLVVLDCIYGCVQATADLTASDVGAPLLDPAQPVQAVALEGGSQLAVTAGGCVLLADLELRPPTLANLLGALCIGAVSSGAGAGAEDSSSSSSPCAAAAAAALHEAELALLLGPSAAGSSAPVPVQYSLEPEEEGAAQRGGDGGAGAAHQLQRLLVPATVRWLEPAAASMQQAERSAWSALLEPAAAAGGKESDGDSGSGGNLLEAARQLLQASQQQGVPVSQRLLCRVLQRAADRQQWQCVEELLTHQHPGSLAGCPGLLPALAEGHQLPLLQLLLSQASDVPVDALARTLKSLLRRPGTAEAEQARRRQLEAARVAAEAAVAAAEQAGAGVSEVQLAVAACSAGVVEGFTATQVCLHPLVAVRHDTATLLGALRQLSSSEALTLLRYLRALLRSFATLVGDRFATAPALPPPLVLPHPLAAVEWAGAAMDANMARLVLQPEAAAVLSDMQGLVESQLRALRRLAQVRGVLQHVQCGGGLPAPHTAAAAKYTLEWLDLRVG